MKIKFISLFIFVYFVSWDLGCGLYGVLFGPTLPTVFYSFQISAFCAGLDLKSSFEYYNLFIFLSLILFIYFFKPQIPCCPFNISSMYRQCFHSPFAFVSRLQHYWLMEDLEPWESFELEDLIPAHMRIELFPYWFITPERGFLILLILVELVGLKDPIFGPTSFWGAPGCMQDCSSELEMDLTCHSTSQAVFLISLTVFRCTHFPQVLWQLSGQVESDYTVFQWYSRIRSLRISLMMNIKWKGSYDS